MKSPALIIGCVALLGGLLWLAWSQQRTMEAGLPPREECGSMLDAWNRAQAYAAKHGGTVVPILGTGSMQPYIPAASAGLDPKKTVVAYCVTHPTKKFADVRRADLCTYHAEWLDGAPVMHQAAEHDIGGWIMSGLHNERSEAHWRVTEANFIGLVAQTFVFP
jgi:hypothetical protein